MEERTVELICKVAEGIATPEEEKDLAVIISQDPEIARELEAQREAVSAVRSVGARELEDKIADQYWAGVFNKLERKSAWILVAVGAVLVLGYGIYELLTQPDISTLYRLGLAALIIGFGLLFSSVLRVRMKMQRYDRYKEVIR